MNAEMRIAEYFRACSVGTAAEIAANFCADAVVYDTNHKPVSGAQVIGEFWDKVRSRWVNAVWSVDTCISEGDVAAIEWSMTGANSDGQFTMRGSEHYRMEGGLIAEIRQYWTFRPGRPDTALVDFPYAERAEYHQRG